jgi:hypothetical protein
VTPSTANPALERRPLSFRDAKLYLATAAMVLGNLLLPYAVHSLPMGGRALLPIFFFTLVAGWHFGAKAGVLTALLSPLANHALTGMPPTPMLQGIILQSAFLAVLAALAARRSPVPTLPLLAGVVLAAQALTLAPVLVLQGVHAATAGFILHIPGILLQILGGYLVLRLLDRR